MAHNTAMLENAAPATRKALRGPFLVITSAPRNEIIGVK